MDHLYMIYKNVIKMVTQPHYRNLDLIDPQLSIKDFEIGMQYNRYIQIATKKADDISIFYLLHYDSEIVRKFQELKKILNKIPKNTKQIYFISNRPFSSQNYRMIMSLRKKIYISLINHEIFAFVLPKHITVPKHRIMTEEEVKDLIQNISLSTELILPKIVDSDTQCVWIGAKPLDIIQITRNTISGESLVYRLVVGATAKKITSKITDKEHKRPHGTKITIPKEVIENKLKDLSKNIKPKKHHLKPEKI